MKSTLIGLTYALFCMLLLLVMLIMGWENTELVEIHYNSTKEVLVEVIKECPSSNLTCALIPDCICNCYKPECKPQVKTIIAPGCTEALNKCNIQLDYKNDIITDLMEENNTKHTEEIEEELKECQDELNETKEKIRDLLD